MAVSSTYPCVHLNMGAQLEGLNGKSNNKYDRFSAFSLQCRYPSNAVNQVSHFMLYFFFFANLAEIILMVIFVHFEKYSSPSRSYNPEFLPSSQNIASLLNNTFVKYHCLAAYSNKIRSFLFDNMSQQKGIVLVVRVSGNCWRSCFL